MEAELPMMSNEAAALLVKGGKGGKGKYATLVPSSHLHIL